ncbi:hypothetical protein ACET3Z_031538 [Daucus carota]
MDWKVRVRVSRTWRHVSATGDLYEDSFIVVDDTASRMHGWIRSALINMFEHDFVEGRVIDIQNFIVRPYRNEETNTCFKADKQMLLTPVTAIFPVHQMLQNFPMHVFWCIPLNLIPDHAEQESYFIEEIPRERFERFLKVCLELEIEQAEFLLSTQMSFRRQSIPHHLQLLKKNSTIHFPSNFAYLVLKGMYRPFQWDDTVKEMALIIANPTLRNRVPEMINLLRDITGDEEIDIFPIYKLCPNARNKLSFLHTGWFPFNHHVWQSLCDKVVNKSLDEVDPYDQFITIDHILQTKCGYCSLQCILYKVLYGVHV